MEPTSVPNIHVLFKHISQFLDAAPTNSDKPVNWAELRQMHETAAESLIHLRNMTLPPDLVEGDPSCPGKIPKH